MHARCEGDDGGGAGEVDAGHRRTGDGSGATGEGSGRWCARRGQRGERQAEGTPQAQEQQEPATRTQGEGRTGGGRKGTRARTAGSGSSEDGAAGPECRGGGGGKEAGGRGTRATNGFACGPIRIR